MLRPEGVHLIRKLIAVVLCGSPNATAMASDTDDAAKRGRAFLVGLFDRQQNLLPEHPGARVYWLYHDNYLAAAVTKLKSMQKQNQNLKFKRRYLMFY